MTDINLNTLLEVGESGPTDIPVWDFKTNSSVINGDKNIFFNNTDGYNELHIHPDGPPVGTAFSIRVKGFDVGVFSDTHSIGGLPLSERVVVGNGETLTLLSISPTEIEIL